MKKRFLLWDNPRQAIYMLMFILLLAGGVNVYSASFVSAQDMFSSGWYYLGRYFLFAAGGMVAIHIVRSIGYRRILNKRFLWYCYVLTFLMLLYVDYMGIANKGATRWIYLGPFSIQPSEIAKLVIILLAARYLGSAMKRGQRVELFTGECAHVTYATLAVAALVVKQPDLGTAAIIVALLIGVFVIAGLAKKWIVGIIGAGLVGAVVLTITSPYRWERIKVWFDPWLDERGSGYQMVQSLLAIGSGGLTGTEWGHGAGKFFYLPEAHTDFAFAIFCQENGLLGAALLLLVFAVMGAAFYRISVSTRDPKGFLLAVGVTFLIIGQAFANMAMVCGILPVIGVPLIFISYGGSSMLISMCAIGLLLSVYDEEERQMAVDAQTPEERRASFRFVHSRR